MKTNNKKNKTGKKTPQPVEKITRELSAKAANWWSWAVAIAAITIAGVALVIFESDFLFRIQELNLFLYTPLFFKQQLVTSGGLLTYVASYFTQFLYHPWLGVSMLCGWWLLLFWLMKRTFNIPSKWALLLLIPVALLLIINMNLGYWIFYIKLRGLFFVATIGTTCAVSLAWIYRSLPTKFFARTIFVVLTAAIGYPVLGFYSLLALLLMAVLSWRLDDYKPLRSSIDTAIAVVAGACIPLVYYWTVYYQTNLVNIYYTALPLYRIDKDYMAYYIPFYLLAATLAILAACYRKERQPKVKRVFWWSVAQVAVLAILFVGTWHFWYKDENFHTELSMCRHATNDQWEDILTDYRDHDAAPSRIMWLMKNLALSHLGRQGDEMYHYRNGDSAPNAPFDAHMAQCGGKLLYYNYGLLNYCYRWCMEDGVEYGWHVDYLIYMLKCSLVNQEMTVAQKYIDILKQTKYYADWASQFEPYVKNPKLLAKNKEFARIQHLLPPVNELTSDQSLVEIFLINHFSTHDSQDPVFQEEALIFALQTKDIATFWGRFIPYARMLNGKHVPTHIQEAAYLYGHLEDKVDISRMPFDKEVADSYKDFMATAQQYNNLPESEMKKLMYNRFGGTFYYDYFFTRDQHSY